MGIGIVAHSLNQNGLDLRVSRIVLYLAYVFLIFSFGENARIGRNISEKVRSATVKGLRPKNFPKRLQNVVVNLCISFLLRKICTLAECVISVKG